MSAAGSTTEMRETARSAPTASHTNLESVGHVEGPPSSRSSRLSLGSSATKPSVPGDKYPGQNSRWKIFWKFSRDSRPAKCLKSLEMARPKVRVAGQSEGSHF